MGRLRLPISKEDHLAGQSGVQVGVAFGDRYLLLEDALLCGPAWL